MRRFIRDLLSVIVILGFIAVVCGGAIFIIAGDDIVDFVQLTLARYAVSSRDDDLNRSAGFDETPIRFTVNSGDSPRIIASNLADAGLIIDENLFVNFVRASALDTELEAGTYFLNQTQTIPSIALALTDSASAQFPFRILEGWRIEEVAEAIDNNPFFDFSGDDFLLVVGLGVVVDAEFRSFVGLPSGASLEGFLYPDTYLLPAGVTALQLRDILLQTFRDRVGTQLVDDAAAQGFTLFEMVTLASIIEKEALHDDEHVLISSAYRNRLEIEMNLDADPTVQYGLQGTRDNDWWPQITQADYRDVISPYNTYLNNGLPPGPIANPGISAIRGAVYPAESNYYYFRAACDGSGYHNFAVTFDEHLANGC